MTLYSVVPKSFYEKPTLELSRALIGCVLVHETPEGPAAGRIVETEAYIGPVDRAAHSYNYRRTKRTNVMFFSPGHVYMYTMHTHALLNIVSGVEDSPEAVLIRAIEPVTGLELIQKRRHRARGIQQTNGPGKLTKALGIDMSYYGHELDQPPLYLSPKESEPAVENGPRVGISGSGEARHYPWRFFETGNPYVSRWRA
ncbi:DNA-3-methyladenine glycosylase [Marinococcus halophilus]|uniref:DNA-3-methyladenine glycosylase n=1 Tax=Marinococcus halophilus TaxID=1371 RepID=UPI0009A86B75|nr:DNA-3-methyladenine glycosylase [Marinococcus halophilus]